MDDLLTGGSTFGEYLSQTRMLLATLRDQHWLISASKARFGYTKLKVLGHIVQPGRVSADPEKVEAV